MRSLPRSKPIIAEAWDRWDHQVRTTPLIALKHHSKIMYSAACIMQSRSQRMARRRQGSRRHTALSSPRTTPPPQLLHTFAHPGGPGPADPAQAAVNEFRARFHRSIIAPAPFRTAFGDGRALHGYGGCGWRGRRFAYRRAIDPHLAVNGWWHAGECGRKVSDGHPALS